MPTTIRALSWNVESLGDAKSVVPGSAPQAPSQMIAFLAAAIRFCDADLVGIMEVKSGMGATVAGWLLARLNNVGGGAPAYTWRAQVSSRQDGGTQEEYLLLWKDQANRLTLDPAGRPGPTSVAGVLDDAALAALLAATGFNAANTKALYDALESAGYVFHGIYRNRSANVRTRSWRVDPDRWEELSLMATPQVDLTGHAPPPLTTTQLRLLARTLLDVDILRFITFADRSPYLASLRLGTVPRPLLVALFHAAGPQDRTRTDAINIIALSRPAQAAANLLVMGDFNIADAQAAYLTGRVYARHSKNGRFVFAQVTPMQTQPVFAPITGAPLNAAALLPANTKTSLVNGYLADAAPIASTLANTFDKLFFRGATVNGANAVVRNLIQAMVPAGGPPSPMATAALSFFRAYRGAAFLNQQDSSLATQQGKLRRKVVALGNRLANVQKQIVNASAAGPVPKNSPLLRRRATIQHEHNQAQQRLAAVTAERTALAVVLALVNNAGAQAPTGVGTAHAVYRHAVSDHLPVSVDLTG